MSITNELDFHKVCRTCLSIGDLKLLYDDNSHLAEMLMTCTPIEYNEEDGLPTQICTGCISELNRSYKFALKCRESNDKLRHYLKQLVPEEYAIPNRAFGLKHPLDNTELQTELEQELIVIKNEINDTSDSNIKTEEPQHQNQPGQSNNNKSYIDKHLKSHMTTKHTLCKTVDNKMYSCPVCSDTFKRKEQLNNHVRAHENKDKSYSCTICKVSFLLKSDLTLHMHTHTEDNLYTCNVCSRAFNLKLHFVSHMRLHTGEKPFSCTICNTSFSHKIGLKHHLRKHVTDKVNSCSICNLTFKDELSLSMHVKHMHSEFKT